MFRVFGDDIEFEGRRCGVLLSTLNATFRMYVESALECAEVDAVPLKEHEEDIRDLEAKHEEALAALQTELDDRTEERDAAEALLERVESSEDSKTIFADLREEIAGLRAANKKWRDAYAEAMAKLKRRRK